MLIGEVFSLYKAIPSFMAQPINLRFPTYFPPPHRPLLLLLLPPMRLNFLGSGGKGPNVSANFHQKTGACFFFFTFPAHLRFVSCPLASFPEAGVLLSDENGLAYPAIFWTVSLFARTIPTWAKSNQFFLVKHEKTKFSHQIILFACSFG